MRYEPGHSARTRERVLVAAARILRESGPNDLSVAGLMAAAGLTHGGFYGHFGSRSELLNAAVDQLIAENVTPSALLALADPGVALGAFIDAYLSPGHREKKRGACPLLLLFGAFTALPEAAQSRLVEERLRITDTIAQLLRQLGRAEAGALADATLAELIGQMVFALSDPDAERAELRLRRARDVQKRRLGLLAPLAA